MLGQDAENFHGAGQRLYIAAALRPRLAATATEALLGAFHELDQRP